MVDVKVYFATNRRGKPEKNATDFTDKIVGDMDSIRLGIADFKGVNLETEDLDALGNSARIWVAPEKLKMDASRSLTIPPELPPL